MMTVQLEPMPHHLKTMINLVSFWSRLSESITKSKGKLNKPMTGTFP